ncbi:hypothetical protein TrVE_jg8324 [Triparma verrucosa]|uniref:Fe2OG dioxygenase domain-containing protein n=1 Tax=Triparma verrucosa TaxID=1606542 RepID=A0A9W7EZ70_9STRA|nr:hypothetical protein TrVE_jg8324 [Triparma verrucosa]
MSSEPRRGHELEHNQEHACKQEQPKHEQHDNSDNSDDHSPYHSALEAALSNLQPAVSISSSSSSHKPYAVDVAEVPGAFLIHNVLTEEETEGLLKAVTDVVQNDEKQSHHHTTTRAPDESNDSAPDSSMYGFRARRPSQHHTPCTVKPSSTKNLSDRIRPFLPPHAGPSNPSILHPNPSKTISNYLRCYSYQPSDSSPPHYDRSITNMRGGNPLETFTAYSLIIYLNSSFSGGCTTFYSSDSRILRTKSGLKKGYILPSSLRRISVPPTPGSILIFPHGRHSGCYDDPLHEGSLVTSGNKTIVRTDVVFKYKARIKKRRFKRVKDKDNVAASCTYASLLTNRPFLFYMLSYLLTQSGTWLNYIATLTLLSDLHPPSTSTSNIYIATLILLRMLPSLIVSPVIGGPVADRYDKRITMVVIDIFSAVVALFILPKAVSEGSISILYCSVFALSVLDAVYNPCKNSIVPFMFGFEEEKINKATSLVAVAWSLMGSVGAMMGGFITGRGGVKLCFLIDGFTFLGSAALMAMVGEGWKKQSKEDTSKNKKVKEEKEDKYGSSFMGGIKYLRTASGSQLLPLVFLKSFGCVLWGSADLLNVVFAKGDEFDLGCIFASVGLGCLGGPLIMDKVRIWYKNNGNGNDNKSFREIKFMVWSSVFAIAVVATSFLGMSLNSDLTSVLFFTVFRSSGSAILWVYSSVLLQLLTDPSVLGRVVSIEFAAATTLEGASAFLAAALLDFGDLTSTATALFYGVFGCVFVVAPLAAYSRRNWTEAKNGGYRRVDNDDDDEEEEVKGDANDNNDDDEGLELI